MNKVKHFFRLSKEATSEQVAFVAAAVTFQANRDKRAGGSSTNVNKMPAIVKKTLLLPSWFRAKPSPAPAMPEDNLLGGKSVGCSHCAGTIGIRQTRVSARQRAGRSTLKNLLLIHRHRNDSHTTADDELTAMVLECEEDRKTQKKLASGQMVAQTAKAMEDILMSGDIVWAQQVLARFLARPSTVEVKKSAPALFMKNPNASKEEQVYEMIVAQLRDFGVPTLQSPILLPWSPVLS